MRVEYCSVCGGMMSERGNIEVMGRMVYDFDLYCANCKNKKVKGDSIEEDKPDFIYTLNYGGKK